MKKVLLGALLFGASMSAFAQPANDACSGAIAIDDLITTALAGGSSAGGPYSNVDATGDDVLVADVTGCWQDDAAGNGDGNDPQVDQTVWFSFEGTGDVIWLATTTCSQTSNTFETGDTQMIVYGGDCGNLSVVGCDEDYAIADGIYWAAVNIATEAGVTYYVAVDGFNYTGYGSPDDPLTDGEFCFIVVDGEVNVEEAVAAKFSVYPNPANDQFTITADEKITSVLVRNMLGEIVFVQDNLNTNSYRVNEQFANGLYLVDVTTFNGKSTRKLVIE